MSGIFKPGQLVTPEDWLDEPIEIIVDDHNIDRTYVSLSIGRIVGSLVPHDVALVIALSNGGTWVYVLGPKGSSGWVAAALLTSV